LPDLCRCVYTDSKQARLLAIHVDSGKGEEVVHEADGPVRRLAREQGHKDEDGDDVNLDQEKLDGHAERFQAVPGKACLAKEGLEKHEGVYGLIILLDEAAEEHHY